MGSKGVKRSAPGHPKMHDLAKLIKSPLHAAVGILEMLWHYTGTYTPRGDIGSVSNGNIAAAVDWRKNQDELVEFLITSRWIDIDAQYRLIIHDWPDHAEDAVKKKLARLHLEFLPQYRHRRDAVPTSSVIRAGASGIGHLASGNGNGTGPVVEVPPLVGKWDEFLAEWPDDKRGVNLGCQFWVSLIDCGEITESNVCEVFAGLGRWKASEQWRKDGGQYIPAIAKPDGEGWLQKRAWKDWPKQAEKESW
jgi:hypothetical protein